jgi:hypothetical protein
MLQFDDRFFEEMGAPHLSPEARKKFAAVAADELERRVGRRISWRLTESQLKEFEAIFHTDRTAAAWLGACRPDYQAQEPYLSLRHKGLSGASLVTSTATALWLENNCPSYSGLTERCADGFRRELLSYRQVIFPAKTGRASGAKAPQPRRRKKEVSHA